MIKKKKDTIKSLAIHEKDVGSTEIQIGLLTDKIIKLSEHFKKFKKDISFLNFLKCSDNFIILSVSKPICISVEPTSFS